MSFIEDLYFGEINPNFHKFQHKEEYKKAYATVDKNEDLLLELLVGKEKSLFIDYINANGEVNGATAYESFAEGFRLAAKNDF